MHSLWSKRWDEVEEYWPRRLLHIASMTSFERQDEATYSNTYMPHYCILTYTWGRWEERDNPLAPALRVNGTSWAIPPVKEEHFTVAAFQKVVTGLGDDGCEWAWIDVACIDQENVHVKADEVGRQASIFKLASRVCVWLSHLPAQELESAMKNLKEGGIAISNNKYTKMEKHEDSIRIAERIHQACTFIFKDPWFSSLWTLQEFVLRKDTDILSAEGNALGFPALRLSDLNMSCSSLFDHMEPFSMSIDNKVSMASTYNSTTRNVVRDITELLRQTGFRYSTWISNPNIQYGTARYRKTSRLEDRVYAIMQAYDLRVGSSARPQESPGLEQLVEEFAIAINAKCPMLGQMFVHERPPLEGRSWQITENSWVPEFLMRYADPRPHCSFRYEKPSAVFLSGKITLFAGMIEALENASFEGNFRMSLDGGALEGPSDVYSGAHQKLSWKIDARGLLDRYGIDKLSVLLLGDVVEDMSWRQKIGLIVHRYNNDAAEGSDRRLGVCLWRSRDLIRAFEQLPWTTAEVNLH